MNRSRFLPRVTLLAGALVLAGCATLAPDGG